MGLWATDRLCGSSPGGGAGQPTITHFYGFLWNIFFCLKQFNSSSHKQPLFILGLVAQWSLPFFNPLMVEEKSNWGFIWSYLCLNWQHSLCDGINSYTSTVEMYCNCFWPMNYDFYPTPRPGEQLLVPLNHDGPSDRRCSMPRLKSLQTVCLALDVLLKRSVSDSCPKFFFPLLFKFPLTTSYKPRQMLLDVVFFINLREVSTFQSSQQSFLKNLHLFTGDKDKYVTLQSGHLLIMFIIQMMRVI